MTRFASVTGVRLAYDVAGTPVTRAGRAQQM